MAFENLTANPKDLFKALSMSERMSAAQSELGKTWLGQLTPSEIAELFPDYFRKNLERATSGGTAMGGGQPGMRPYESLIPGNRGGYSGSGGGSGGGSEGGTGGTSGASPGTAMKPAWLKKVYAAAEKEGWKPSSSEAAGNLDRKNPLAQQRQRLSSGLTKEQKIHIYALSIAEKGDSDRTRNIMLMESMYNRHAAYRAAGYQKNIMDATKRDYYQPLREDEDPRGYKRYLRAKERLERDPRYFEKFDQIHEEVLAGSNESKLATHNASLGVADSARRTQTITVTSGKGRGTEYYSRKDKAKFSRTHGAGITKAEKAWFDNISKSMAAYEAAKQQRNATSVQTGDPSQTGKADVGGSVRDLGPDKAKAKFSSKSIASRSENLKSHAKSSLDAFRTLSPNDTITSTYRSKDHEIERKKKRPGAHTRGEAIDIRTRGKSEAELQETIRNLKKSGFNYILLEGNPPHIHAEAREKGDFTIRNLGKGNPSISLDAARQAAETVEFKSVDIDKEQSLSEYQKEIEYPPNYDKLPEDWRKAIDSLSDSEKRNALSAIKYLQDKGKTPEELNSMWEESKQELAQAQQTVGEAPDALKTAEELLKLPAPKIVDSMEGIPTANRFSRQNIDPYRVQRDIVKVQTAYGPANLHKESAPAFVAAFQELKDSGFPMKKVGSLNIRKKTNSNDWSEHSYGNAVDLNDSTTLTRDQKRWMEENPGKFHEILGKYGIRNTSKTNHLEYRGAMPKEGGEIIAQRIEAYKALQRGDAEQPVMVTAPPTQVPSDPYAVQTPGDPRQTGAFSGPEGKDRGIPGSVRQVNSSPTTAPAAPTPTPQPTSTAAPEKRTESPSPPSPETSADVKPTVTAAPVAEPPKKSAEEAPKPQKNRRGGAANNRDLTAIPTPNEQKTPPPKAMKFGGRVSINNEPHAIINQRTGETLSTLNAGEERVTAIEVTPPPRVPAEAIEEAGRIRNNQNNRMANETNQENRANNLEPGSASDATATARPSAPVSNEKQLPKEFSSNLSSKTFYDAVEQSKRFVASSRSQGNPKRPEHTEWNGNRVVG